MPHNVLLVGASDDDLLLPMCRAYRHVLCIRAVGWGGVFTETRAGAKRWPPTKPAHQTLNGEEKGEGRKKKKLV